MAAHRGDFLPPRGTWWGTPLWGREQPRCSSLGRGRKDKDEFREKERES